MPEKITIELSDRENKVNSTRWNNFDDNSPVSSLYVKKPFFQKATRLRLTLEEIPEGEQ